MRKPDFSIGALHDFRDSSWPVRILDHFAIDQVAQARIGSDP
jgi:hypothetical protein